MSEQIKKEKIIKGLAICKEDSKLCFGESECGYQSCFPRCWITLASDALELLKAQNEVIEDLLKVGYPHNFQREEPWIVDYMYAITKVIKKAVNLNNESAK